MKGQFHPAPAKEIVNAWRPPLHLATSTGSFTEEDFNSVANYFWNYRKDREDSITQCFLAIEKNDPHLAADLAQKILLEESITN